MSTTFLKSKSLLEKKTQKVSSIISKYTSLAKSKFSTDLGSIEHELLTNKEITKEKKEFIEKYHSEIKKATELDSNNIDSELQDLFNISQKWLVFKKYTEVIIFLSSLEDNEITYKIDKTEAWYKLKDFFSFNKDWQIIVS